MTIPAEIRLLAWIALTWLTTRSFGICTLVFFSLNLEIVRAPGLQIRSRCATPSPRPSPDDWAATSSQRNNSNTHPSPHAARSITSASKAQHQRQAQHTPQTHQTALLSHQLPPPPYSLIPPRFSRKEPSPPDLITLYESIISADAHTIRVQQATLTSQQDMIHSQAEMIRKLRYVLEKQDQQIEDVNDARGRAGIEKGLGMRGRSI